MNLDEWTPDCGEELSVDDVDMAIRAMQLARIRYEDAKKISNDACHEWEEGREQVISMLTALGKTRYYVDDIGTVSVRSKWTWRTPKTFEEKQAFFKYITEKHGQDTLVGKLTVNHATLNSFCNEEQKAATSEGVTDFKIPGLEAPTAEFTLSVTKPRT